MLFSFCSGHRALGVLWHQQKEAEFRIEMREHRALPKPTPGSAPGWGSSAHRGKAKGATVAWGELPPGPHSPPGWGLSRREAGCFRLSSSHGRRAPHLSAAVSEPAWSPAVSLPCRAAAAPRRTPGPLPRRRSGAGSAGESRGTVTLSGAGSAGTPCHGAAVGQRVTESQNFQGWKGPL